MHPLPDLFVTANGIRTRYWSVGQGGVPLVLLHGLSGTIEDWAGTMRPLAQNRRVIAIDLLGSGRTDKPAESSYAPEAMRDHVLATLDALKLDVVDLNGWSLGGRIALDLAYCVPHRLRRLVVTAPAGIGPDTLLNLSAPWPTLLQQAATRPAASGIRIIRNVLRSDGGMRLFQFTLRRLELAADRPSRIAFLKQLRGFIGPSGYLPGPRQELLGLLPHIDVPTLAIWGRQDNFAPFSHAATLINLLPDARLTVIENCGHTPHVEWPEKYIEAVNEFLR